MKKQNRKILVVAITTVYFILLGANIVLWTNGEIFGSELAAIMPSTIPPTTTTEWTTVPTISPPSPMFLSSETIEMARDPNLTMTSPVKRSPCQADLKENTMWTDRLAKQAEEKAAIAQVSANAAEADLVAKQNEVAFLEKNNLTASDDLLDDLQTQTTEVETLAAESTAAQEAAQEASDNAADVATATAQEAQDEQEQASANLAAAEVAEAEAAANPPTSSSDSIPVDADIVESIPLPLDGTVGIPLEVDIVDSIDLPLDDDTNGPLWIDIKKSIDLPLDDDTNGPLWVDVKESINLPLDDTRNNPLWTRSYHDY